MSDSQTQNFDAVIVGAGVSGAMIAWQLGLKGKRVLILEAGDPLPPNVNDYMQRFYLATAKVPEIPYTPDLMDSTGLVDPGTMNAPRPTVLTLGDNWQDPKQAYLDQTGKLPLTGRSATMTWNAGTATRNTPSACRPIKPTNPITE
jgi:glucose dehydrogenase